MSTWTTIEIRLLRDLRDGAYGYARRKEICLMFPRHSPKSVDQRINVLEADRRRDVVEKSALARLRRAVEMQNRVFT